LLPTRCSTCARITIWLIGCSLLLASARDANAQGFGGGGSPSGGQPPGEEKPPPRIPYFGPTTNIPLKEVRIVGNRGVSEATIRSHLETRVDRAYDPEQVQKDVRTLIGTGLFRNVRTYQRDFDGGVSVTFEFFERPLIQYICFVGNKKIKDKALLKELGFKVGDALHRFPIEEGRRAVEQFYKDKGYSEAIVTVLEGVKPDSRGVAYEINEGVVLRVADTEFEGNTIASDARLKTQIKSKPGILWYFGGKTNDDQIEQDIEQLTAYYRGLGYFKARVSREIEVSESQKWMDIKFIIDEGPRYRIRSIKTVGNDRFDDPKLRAKMTLNEGEFFNLAKMRTDLISLRDHYGSQGYIVTDIKGNPTFLEEPGQLDLVYKITEGEQYRVGRIFVNIEGDHSHTRRKVVLNRLSFRTGDVIDIREIRNSERRLQASQLFLHNPAQGVTPRIVVKPPGPDQARIARQPSSSPPQGSTSRGQSPDKRRRFIPIDIVVDGVESWLVDKWLMEETEK